MPPSQQVAAVDEVGLGEQILRESDMDTRYLSLKGNWWMSVLE